jgi:hypothetical protein
VAGVEVAERVRVPFTGEGGGVDALSWGQRSIWSEMVRAGNSLTMTAVRVLGPGATVDEVVDEYRFYLSRYQTMRTLLRFEPDGRVLQVVEESGTAEIAIYDAGGRDPGEVAAEISTHHTVTPFDYEREWPMRMALVRRDGVPTHLVVTLSHHVADPASAMAMFTDLGSRDPATGEPPRPPGLQPLAQARLQRAPAARRQNEAALRYWEEQLRVIPPTMLPLPDGPMPDRADRFWEADYVSPSLHLALGAVAARLGVNTRPVLYAAYAVALARTTGIDHVATTITVNNRFRPGLADAAGHMSQHGLCTLDVGDADDFGFDALVLRARRRLLLAQKHAYYAQDEVDELIARVGRERGVSFELLCLFNDRRGEDDPAGAVPREAEVPASSIVWRWMPSLHQRLMLHFNPSPDSVSVLVQADTAYLDRGTVELFLRRMENAAVGARK